MQEITVQITDIIKPLQTFINNNDFNKLTLPYYPSDQFITYVFMELFEHVNNNVKLDDSTTILDMPAQERYNLMYLSTCLNQLPIKINLFNNNYDGNPNIQLTIVFNNQLRKAYRKHLTHYNNFNLCNDIIHGDNTIIIKYLQTFFANIHKCQYLFDFQQTTWCVNGHNIKNWQMLKSILNNNNNVTLQPTNINFMTIKIKKAQSDLNQSPTWLIQITGQPNVYRQYVKSFNQQHITFTNGTTYQHHCGSKLLDDLIITLNNTAE